MEIPKHQLNRLIENRLQTLVQTLARDAQVTVKYGPAVASGFPAMSHVAYKKVYIDSCNPVEADAVRNLILGKGKLFHELAHLLFTTWDGERPIYANRAKNRNAFLMLSNILEDGRIEKIITRHFPGVQPYFDYIVSYFTPDGQAMNDLVFRVRGHQYSDESIKQFFAPVEHLIEQAIDAVDSLEVLKLTEQILAILPNVDAPSQSDNCYEQPQKSKAQPKAEKSEKQESKDGSEKSKSEKSEDDDEIDADDSDSDADSNEQDETADEDGQEQQGGADGGDGDENESEGDSGAGADDSEDGDDAESSDGGGEGETEDNDGEQTDGGGAGNNRSDREDDDEQTEESANDKETETPAYGDAKRNELADELYDDLMAELEEELELERITIQARNRNGQKYRDTIEASEAAALTQVFKKLQAQSKREVWKPSLRSGRVDSHRIVGAVTGGSFLKRRGRIIDKRPAVVTVIDTSCSMNSKIDRAAVAARIVNGAVLDAGLDSAVLTFDSRTKQIPEVPLHMSSPGSSTMTADALQTAGKELVKRPEPRKLIIIITDGCPGDSGQLPAVKSFLNDNGIFVAAVILGMGDGTGGGSNQATLTEFAKFCDICFYEPESIAQQLTELLVDFTR